MKVRFVPQNVEFEIQPNQSVMNVAQDNGLFIKSICKGLPSCAECRVRIVEGEHNVVTPSSAELALIGTAHFVDRRRLSCQIRCFGDITVDLAEQEEKRMSQGKRPRGKGPRDAAESFAVRGNMIDDKVKERIAAQVNVSLLTEDIALDDDDEEEEISAKSPIKIGSGSGSGSAPAQAGPGGAKKRRRRRRRRPGAVAPGGSSNGSKPAGS